MFTRKSRRTGLDTLASSAIFLDFLTGRVYCWKSDEDLTEGLRDDRVREILQKNSKSLTSVFPTEGFLRPGTQVRQFGRKLKALDAFFVLKLDAKL